MAFRRRIVRIVIGGLAAALLSLALLQTTGGSRSVAQAAASSGRSSSQVAVIPGFTAPKYTGFFGVPNFPVNAPQVSAYHFSQLATAQVTTASLANYDTVILYGIRWSDIPTSAQTAINTFAATHKVMIWDSDGTGAQTFGSFVHPFSDNAGGENFSGKANDSVVSFPSGNNFLASKNPSSPYYLDPNQLVTDRDEINDMNAMTTGTAKWVPALYAANKSIPKGGWPLAWTYGVIGNHTGLAMYSGIDADAFGDTSINPNNALKELQLQLKAPFLETPDQSCAPNCKLPSGGSGPPIASCSFAKPLPKHWVHGRVPLALKTSVAAAVTGKIVSGSGKTLAKGKEKNGVIRLRVQTKHLPTNRTSKLQAEVFVKGQQACTKAFTLKVDNTPPRLLMLKTNRSSSSDWVSLRVSEVSSLALQATGLHRKPVLVAANRTVNLHFSRALRSARLTVRDRAGNVRAYGLHW
jgi:hypothetical protein